MIHDLTLRCAQCQKWHEWPYKILQKRDKDIYFHSKSCFDLYMIGHTPSIRKPVKKTEIKNTEKNFFAIMFGL